MLSRSYDLLMAKGSDGAGERVLMGQRTGGTINQVFPEMVATSAEVHVLFHPQA